MTTEEFEKYLETLSEEGYDALVAERITRLNEEQKALVLAREVRRKERAKLYHKLDDPDPKVRQEVLDTLMEGEGHQCEHGRSWVKHCVACGHIDHAMFPELFDEDGLPIQEESNE
jgi:hypothetical protein